MSMWVAAEYVAHFATILHVTCLWLAAGAVHQGCLHFEPGARGVETGHLPAASCKHHRELQESAAMVERRPQATLAIAAAGPDGLNLAF